MAEYNGMILTDLGKNLFLRAQGGERILITRVEFGSGFWDFSSASGADDGEKLRNFAKAKTALETPRNSFGVMEISIAGDTAQVKALVSNSGNTEGYPIREIGVWARDPDDSETEILYCVTYAGDRYDWMPADDGINAVEYLDEIYIAVGQAENVTIIVDGTVILATQLDIEAAIAAHNTSPEAHSELFQEFGNMKDILDRIGLPGDPPADGTTLFAGQQIVYNYSNTILGLLGNYDHPDYPTVAAYLKKLLQLMDYGRLYTQVFDFSSVADQAFVMCVHNPDNFFNREVRVFEKVQESGTGNEIEDFSDAGTVEIESIPAGDMSHNGEARKGTFPDVELDDTFLGMAVYAENGGYIGTIYEVIDPHTAYLNRSSNYTGNTRLLPAEVKEGKLEHVSYGTWSFLEKTVSHQVVEELPDAGVSVDGIPLGDLSPDPGSIDWDNLIPGQYVDFTYQSYDSRFEYSLVRRYWKNGNGDFGIPEKHSNHRFQNDGWSTGFVSAVQTGLNLFIQERIANGDTHLVLKSIGGRENVGWQREWKSHKTQVRYLDGNGDAQVFAETDAYLLQSERLPIPVFQSDSWEIDISMGNYQDHACEGLLFSQPRGFSIESLKPHGFISVRSHRSAEAKTRTMDMSSWARFEGITITASADVKICFSVDGGTSWKKYNSSGNTWDGISDFSGGNSLDLVNNLSQSELDMLLGMGLELKLGLYLPDSETSYFDHVDIQYGLDEQYKLADQSQYEVFYLSERNTRVRNVSGSEKNIRVSIKDIKKSN